MTVQTIETTEVAPRPARAPAPDRMTVQTIESTEVASRPADSPPPAPALGRRRLPTWWRTAIGLALAVGALGVPWIGLNLSPNLTAWRINLALADVPVVGHVSYGEILLVVVLAAAVSVIRSRGRPTNVTRLCGWALVLIALIFVAATRTMGGELLFRLSTDMTQTQIVDRQAAFRYGPPTSFLGFTLDPTTMMVTNGLQVGWYLTLLAGGLMAGRPVHALRHRRAIVIAMVVIGAVLVWGFTSGLLAQTARSDGLAAEQAGHSSVAERDFNRALSLNPQLRYDNALETDLGHAEADQGQKGALTWLAAAASPPTLASAVQIAQQVFDYSEALALAPHNPVIQSDFAVALSNDMVRAGAPLAPGAVADLGPFAFLSFTYGHYAYVVGDSSTALAYLQRSMSESGNGELQSIALTYMALSEQRLGDPPAFRQDIVRAVDLDTQEINGLGREVAAGLYTPGPPS